MLNEDIQKELEALNKGRQKKRPRRRWLSIGLGVALVALLSIGVGAYHKGSTQISERQLSQLVIVAARTGGEDPIHLMQEIERYIGTHFSELSQKERSRAVEFLMDYIELHENKKGKSFY